MPSFTSGKPNRVFASSDAMRARQAREISTPPPMQWPWIAATVGTFKLALDGQTVYEAPLVALEDYAEGGFFKRMSDSVWLWFDDGE